jgi:hypothetical protein
MTVRSGMASLPAVVCLIGLVCAGCGNGSPPVRTGPGPRHHLTSGPTSSVPTPSTFPTPTTTTTIASSAPSCVNGQVSVSAGSVVAGLGHVAVPFVFTNQSQATCTLSGYPGVAGLNEMGNQVVQAERTLGGYMGPFLTSPNLPVVPLAPGQSASALIESTDNPIGTATTCPAYPSFLVTPPNLTVSVRQPIPNFGSDPGIPGCSQIDVHPVVPGDTGRVGPT